MKRLVLLSLASLLVAIAVYPVSLGAQTTCSCPWQVVQGDNTGATNCAYGHQLNEGNLKSYAFWACGNHTPCTTVYTPLSCTTDQYSTVTASGLLNYKCC